MRDFCEVCEGFKPGQTHQGNYRVIEVDFDVRRVRLCVGHARIAEKSGASTFDALRELFGKDRRSFIPRRNPRAPIGKGPPRTLGRRATDSIL